MDILEILIDSLLDCLKMLPFIFLTYILIEVVERRADFAKHGKFLEGGFAPAAGALAGVFPKDETVTALVLLRLVAEALRRKGTDAANRAAEELERLLSDSELLDQYRSSLLES